MPGDKPVQGSGSFNSRWNLNLNFQLGDSRGGSLGGGLQVIRNISLGESASLDLGGGLSTVVASPGPLEVSHSPEKLSVKDSDLETITTPSLHVGFSIYPSQKFNFGLLGGIGFSIVNGTLDRIRLDRNGSSLGSEDYSFISPQIQGLIRFSVDFNDRIGMHLNGGLKVMSEDLEGSTLKAGWMGETGFHVLF